MYNTNVRLADNEVPVKMNIETGEYQVVTKRSCLNIRQLRMWASTGLAPAGYKCRIQIQHSRHSIGPAVVKSLIAAQRARYSWAIPENLGTLIKL